MKQKQNTNYVDEKIMGENYFQLLSTARKKQFGYIVIEVKFNMVYVDDVQQMIFCYYVTYLVCWFVAPFLPPIPSPGSV